jgi:hypothetical protein
MRGKSPADIKEMWKKWDAAAEPVQPVREKQKIGVKPPAERQKGRTPLQPGSLGASGLKEMARNAAYRRKYGIGEPPMTDEERRIDAEAHQTSMDRATALLDRARRARGENPE